MSDYQSTAQSLEYLGFTTAAIAHGNGYSAGELFTGVANGNTKTVYIDNQGNDTDVVVLTPNVSSNGQVYSNAISNPTEDTQGNSATVQTVSTGGNGFDASVRTAGDNETGIISGGNPYPEVTIGGGGASSGVAVGVGTNPAQIAAIIEPDDLWAVEVTNESGNASDISINLSLAEVEVSKV